MSNCIFCKIINGEIGKVIEESKNFVIFESIEPKAKVHLLVVPKKHITGLEGIEESEFVMLTGLFPLIQKMSKRFNLKNGYRLVANQGTDAGQSIPHLHFHLLGGEKLSFAL
jgi:histidine triad (HIT) family protein